MQDDPGHGGAQRIAGPGHQRVVADGPAQLPGRIDEADQRGIDRQDAGGGPAAPPQARVNRNKPPR